MWNLLGPVRTNERTYARSMDSRISRLNKAVSVQYEKAIVIRNVFLNLPVNNECVKRDGIVERASPRELARSRAPPVRYTIRTGPEREF